MLFFLLSFVIIPKVASWSFGCRYIRKSLQPPVFGASDYGAMIGRSVSLGARRQLRDSRQAIGGDAYRMPFVNGYSRRPPGNLLMRPLTFERDDVLPRPLVICGPSGVGKGTIINKLLENKENANFFDFTVSHTTRQPRPGEIDHTHYHFTTYEAMKNDIRSGKFIEHAEVHGNFYGTSLDAVELVQSKGKIPLLDIDVQGVRSVRESGLRANFIFIAPPSLRELEDRLRGRGTEDEESMKRRIGNASAELEYGLAKGNFDRIVTNAELSEAVSQLESIVISLYSNLLC